MRLAMELFETMRNPPLVARRKHPSFVSVRAAVLGFAGITTQELWSIHDARAFDLRAGVLRIPAKRIVERYKTPRGHGHPRLTVVVEQRVVNLNADANRCLSGVRRVPGPVSRRWEADEVRVFRRGVVPTGVARCVPPCRFRLFGVSVRFGTDRAPSNRGGPSARGGNAAHHGAVPANLRPDAPHEGLHPCFRLGAHGRGSVRWHC
jgi:hypothetical protein